MWKAILFDGTKTPAFVVRSCGRDKILHARNAEVYPRTERQFLSDAKCLSPGAMSQFPLKYFLLNRSRAVIDTRKPLASVYRILSFADAIFIGTFYRRAAGDAVVADTRTPIYHYGGLLLRSCIYAPSFDVQVSYFFIAYLKRDPSSLRAGRHKFIKAPPRDSYVNGFFFPSDYQRNDRKSI